MMAGDVIRMQMALAFGALAMQQRMVSGCWQMALWWSGGLAAGGEGMALPVVASPRRARRGG